MLLEPALVAAEDRRELRKSPSLHLLVPELLLPLPSASTSTKFSFVIPSPPKVKRISFLVKGSWKIFLPNTFENLRLSEAFNRKTVSQPYHTVT